MPLTAELLAQLESLASELEADIAASQTRDQHIRATLRFAKLELILRELKAVDD